jgi:hypothetical protein
MSQKETCHVVARGADLDVDRDDAFRYRRAQHFTRIPIRMTFLTSARGRTRGRADVAAVTVATETVRARNHTWRTKNVPMPHEQRMTVSRDRREKSSRVTC